MTAALGQRVVKDLRIAVYEKIVGLNLRQFDTTPIGTLTTRTIDDLNNDDLSPLFLAVWEATEEALLNSLFMATDTKGKKGREVKALPIKKTIEILKKYNALNQNMLPMAIEK